MSGPDDDSKAEDFRRPFSDSDTEECSHTIQTLLAEAAQTMEKASNIALDEFDLDCSHGEATSRAVMPRSRERLAAEAKGLEALDEALVHLATRLGRRRTACGACIAAGSDDGSIAEDHNQVSSGSAAHSAQPKTLKGVVRHHIEENLLVLYEVPKVRQYHEDPLEEHQVDWADLFFDLTYVAATKKMGHVLGGEVTWLGVFHFGVLALSLHDAWKFKTLHDSTFSDIDVVHKFVDVCYVCSVASAALFIQPNEEMESLSNGYAFGLSLSLAVNVALHGFEKLEIAVRSKSEHARDYSWLELAQNVAPRLMCYSAAAAYTGAELYRSKEDETTGGRAWMYTALMLFGAHVLGTWLPWCLMWIHAIPAPMLIIPWHYEHIAERFGAWVMLMLGESVLSIILEPIEDDAAYYCAFFTALVTVQAIQLSHYSSAEFDPWNHALSRSIMAGLGWLEMMALFSLALVVLGVGLQLQLRSVICHDQVEEGSAYHRRLLLVSSTSSSQHCENVPRAYTTLLCGASVVQYLAQQVILPLHEGLDIYLAHFVDSTKRHPYFMFSRLAVVKAATVVGTIVLGCFPEHLNALDILLVVAAITIAQGLTQTMENMVVHVGQLEAKRLKKNKDRKHRRPLYRRALHRSKKRLGLKKTKNKKEADCLDVAECAVPEPGSSVDAI